MSQYARSDGPCHDETSFAGRGHVATGVPRAWTPRLSGADTYMQSSLCDRACPRHERGRAEDLHPEVGHGMQVEGIPARGDARHSEPRRQIQPQSDGPERERAGQGACVRARCRAAGPHFRLYSPPRLL